MIKICVICREPFDTKDRPNCSKTCSEKCSKELRQIGSNKRSSEWNKKNKYWIKYNKNPIHRESKRQSSLKYYAILKNKERQIKYVSEYQKQPNIKIKRSEWQKKHYYKLKAEKSASEMFQIMTLGSLSTQNPDTTINQ